MVKFLTTGHGAVRFNPNLYQDGKVCLSLLGTWQGPGWNPTESTLEQVLVSIQSMILVKDPYFNEPGFEGTMHTAEGRQSSNAYNESVRRNTLRVAIFDQLQTPVPGFEAAIRQHFRLKQEEILIQAEQWGEKSFARDFISALKRIDQ